MSPEWWKIIRRWLALQGSMGKGCGSKENLQKHTHEKSLTSFLIKNKQAKINMLKMSLFWNTIS